MIVLKKICIVFIALVAVIYAEEFRLGLENIPDDFIQKIKNARIGLITNQTGKDQKGKRNVDVLHKRGLHIEKILVPEHGFSGIVSAGKHVYNTSDKATGIPIISLYQEGKRQEINKEIANKLDIFMFDIQDSGMRHYTYISTLHQALEAAALFDKQFIVLDRPNPLGYVMEGPLVDVTYQSFIAIAPIPLRHALTIGEIAWFFNTYLLKKQAKLHVIRMNGYDRSTGLQSMGFCSLSPNIVTLQSCYGYSFLGLLGEVQQFDVGIGTDKAFQVILLPEKFSPSKETWINVQVLLQKNGIESKLYTTYNQAKKQRYTGLEIQIGDINKVNSFVVLIDMLSIFKKAGVQLTFSEQFDKAVGTKKIRTYWRGVTSRKQLVNSINENLNNFLAKVKSSLLYAPNPKPVMLQ